MPPDILDDDKNEKDETMKSGKFSAIESKQIMERIDAYLAAHNLTYADICPGLRDSDSETGRLKKTNHDIWKHMHDLMAHRTRKSIYLHAYRKIMLIATNSKTWTDQDKELLPQLVAKHGKNWSIIGRIMGRHPDNCKHAAERNVPRNRTGRFQPDEDDNLVRSIQQITDSTGKSIADTPAKGISWGKIATLMNNDRHPKDYARRWAHLR